MKVFLSWSGRKSHQVALILRDWLPSVIQSIMPYVSSEDIDKGARWSTDIAKELEDSTFGILCVTRDNLEAPWLLFEAGALSKMMEKSAVCPFIFDLKRAEIKGPILQFQSTIFEKEDVKKLVLSLNKACVEFALKEELLIKTFEVWWPKLESDLNNIKDESIVEDSNSIGKDLKNEILEEILELSRTNQKLLRSPDVILPPDYLDSIINEKLNRHRFEEEEIFFEELRMITKELGYRFQQMREEVEVYNNESKFIDEEFYVNFRKFIDMFERQQAITNRLFRNPKRRRMLL